MSQSPVSTPKPDEEAEPIWTSESVLLLQPIPAGLLRSRHTSLEDLDVALRPQFASDALFGESLAIRYLDYVVMSGTVWPVRREANMHRDMKIGLALAVLLIGVVGAFFFRNESDSSGAGTQVVDYGNLDRQIAEKEMVPYLTGVEVYEKRASTDGVPSRKSSAGAGSATGFDPFDVKSPDVLKGSKGSERNSQVAPHEPPPDPIPAEPKPNATGARAAQKPSAEKTAPVSMSKPAESAAERTQRPVTTNAPQANQAWEAVTPQSPVSNAQGDFRTHRVAKGETLSDLAKLYLGDSTRFLEIFEANRDVLRNPDDVKLGMELRIPQAPSKHPTAPSAKTNEEAPTTFDPAAPSAKRENPTGQPSGNSRFQPVRRTPLNPGKSIPSASNSQGQAEARE